MIQERIESLEVRVEIEVLDYLRRFQDGEFNLLHVGILYLAGLASVQLATRVLGSRTALEPAGMLTLGALAPVIGLILTSTVYTCVSCNAPLQCDVVTVGVPFPQSVAERNSGSRPPVSPCWWSLTETSQLALAGNFALGTLGIPFLVMFLRPRKAAGDPRTPPSEPGSTRGPAS